MKLQKDEYFNLLNDALQYNANQADIDAFIQKEQEAEAERERKRKEKPVPCDGPLAQDEIDALLSFRDMPAAYLPIKDVTEVEISDDEYAELKRKSTLLWQSGGCGFKDACSFQSYKQQYENEQAKVVKLKRIIVSIAERDYGGREHLVWTLLDELL